MQRLNTYQQSLEMLYQDIKRKCEGTEKKSKTSSYSPFGAFCISWWGNGGLQKVYVQDEGRAKFLFATLSKVDKKCSLLMLERNETIISMA